MARHVLGILGVMAAGILLAVSAAMNYRFGFSLGKTALDGQIYGLASASADCFKALAPFFFFAAVRSRMWSQALAAALVWTVVSGYSMTSALGHAALNRLDTTGQRAVAAANYKDLRADSNRAQEQLTWIPAHRPADTVSAELNVVKAQRHWMLTKECTEVAGRSAREFCQQFHKLNAELASAQQSEKLETRIADIGAKLAKTASGGTVMADADPQAHVLSKLSGFDIEAVQTALAILVAVLIEVGSGFGMYVAFAYWRLHDQVEPKAHKRTTAPVAVAQDAVVDIDDEEEALARTGEPPAEGNGPPSVDRFGANDNRMPAKPMLPDSDVQRFYREQIVAAGGSSLTLHDLYGAYCAWTEARDKEALAMPTFSREFKALGVRKEKIGGRVRYFDVGLRAEPAQRSDEKAPTRLSKAA